MGLNQQEKINYLNIINGMIAVKCADNTPGAVEITTKSGIKKYYLMYKSISGFLYKITYKPPPESHVEYGWQWNITIKDKSEMFNLNIPFSSGTARAFFCILPNIKLDSKIEIIPKISKETYEGKTREKKGLFIKQNDSVLQWYYKKDNNADLPEVDVTKTKSGKIIYDDTERNEFFKKLADSVNEKLFILNSHKEITETIEAGSPETLQDDSGISGINDLPF